jgi:hypothetical protein
MFELYEIWAEDEIGHLELIDTTKSRTQAFEIAKAQIELGAISSTVFQETEDGDTVEIKRFEPD